MCSSFGETTQKGEHCYYFLRSWTPGQIRSALCSYTVSVARNVALAISQGWREQASWTEKIINDRADQRNPSPTLLMSWSYRVTEKIICHWGKQRTAIENPAEQWRGTNSTGQGAKAKSEKNVDCPSPISLMVSADVKHHVYLLCGR